MHVDRSSSLMGSRVGLILTSLEGNIIQNALCFRFWTTNNEAEYEALAIGLKMVKELGVPHLKVCRDSQLVVRYI